MHVDPPLTVLDDRCVHTHMLLPEPFACRCCFIFTQMLLFFR